MSSLIKKNGWFYYQFRDRGKTRTKAMKTKDPAEARRIRKAWDARVSLVKTGQAPRKTPLSATFAEFLERKAQVLRPGSVLRYGEIIRDWERFLADFKVEYWHQLTPEMISQFLEDGKKQGRAPKTLDDSLSLLRSVLRWLHQEERISEIPIRVWPHIRTIPGQPDRLGAYSREDIRRMKEFFRFREFEAVFLFTIFTGARRAEVRAAMVQDVRLEDGVILLRNLKTVTGPGNMFRVLAIHPDLRRILEDRTRGRAPSEKLFPEMGNHSRDWPHEQVMNACEKLKIQYRRFHGLRHSFASYLIAGGVDIRQAMEALGHQKLETTQRYASLTRKTTDVSKLGF